MNTFYECNDPITDPCGHKCELSLQNTILPLFNFIQIRCYNKIPVEIEHVRLLC